MKRIINGKMYNTETAKLVARHNCYDNGNYAGYYGVFLKKTGEFFYASHTKYITIWENEIEPITAEKAKKYVEQYMWDGNMDDEEYEAAEKLYIELWGEPEE